MTPKDSVEDVKSTILALLLSRKGGCSLKQLSADYKETENVHIPWKQLGFSSLLGFIHSMPDVVRVEYKNNTVILRGIPTEKSKHISKFVAEQKSQLKNPPLREKICKPSRYYPSAGLHTRTLIPPHALEKIMDLISKYPDGVDRNYVLEQLHLCAPELNITMKDMEEQFKKFPSRVYQNSNMIYPVKSVQRYDYSTQNTNNIVSSKSTIVTAAGHEDNILDHDDNVFEFVPTLNLNNSSQVLSNVKSSSSFIKESVSNYQDKYEETSSLGTEPSKMYKVYKDYNGFIQVEINNDKRKHEDESVHDDDDDHIIINEKLKSRLKRLAEKYPDGIWCADLPAKYMEEYGYQLQYTELGFNSVREFTSYLSDIFQCIQIEDKGDFKLYSVKKDLSAFILKERQDSENEEALPSKLSLNTFKALVPEEVMGNGDRINYLKPQNFLLKGSYYLEVFVVDVFTPTFFWVQLRKRIREFQELMANLENFYSLNFQKYCIPPIVLEKGLNCACKYNGKWHRAIVEKVSPDFAITVMFYDYGTLKTYSVNEIFYLHKRFSDLPAQAIPCGLINVMPRSGSTKWTYAATQRFAQRVGKIPLVATIASICDEDNSMMIVLTDTLGDDDVHINDWLISENLAIQGKEIKKVDMNNLLLYDEDNLLNNQKLCYEEEPEIFNETKKRIPDRKVANAPLISPQSILDDTAYKPLLRSSLLRNEYKILSSEENVQNQNLPSLQLFRYNRNNTNPFLQEEQSVYDISPQEFMQLWNENLIVQTQISETLNLLMNKLNSATDEDTLNEVKRILSNVYMQIPNCTDPVNAGVANICRDTITSISSYLWDTDFNKNKTSLFSRSSNKNNNFSGYAAPIQNNNMQEVAKYPNWTNDNYLIPGNDFVVANRQYWEVDKFDQSKFNDVQNYFTNDNIDLFKCAEKSIDSNASFKETNPFRLSLPTKLQIPSINEKEDNSHKNRESIIYDVMNIEKSTNNNQYVNGNIESNGTSFNGNEYLKLHSKDTDERNNSIAKHSTQMTQTKGVDDLTKAMSNINIGDQLSSSISEEKSHCLSTSKNFLNGYGLQTKKQGSIFVDTFNLRQSASIQNVPMMLTTNCFGYPMPGNNTSTNDGYLTFASTSHPLCNSRTILKTKDTPQYNQNLMMQKYNEMFEDKNKICKDGCQVMDSKNWTLENWAPVAQPIPQNTANSSSDNSKQQNTIQAVQDLSNVRLDNMGLQTLYVKQYNFKSITDSSKYLSLNAKVFFQVVDLQIGIVHVFHYKDDGWLLIDEFVHEFTQFETSWYMFQFLTASNMPIRYEEVDRTKNAIEFLTTNSVILKPTQDILNGVTQLYLMSLKSAIQVLHKLGIISQENASALYMYETFLIRDSVAYDIWLVMNAYKKLKCSIEQSG